MANNKTYICDECGASSSKWAGKCSSCNSWNSISEVKNTNQGRKNAQLIELSAINSQQHSAPRKRIKTTYAELDEVLGEDWLAGRQ